MPPSALPAAPRVLVLLPSVRDAERTASLLEEDGVQSVVCAGLVELCQEVRSGADAVVLSEEAILGDSTGQLTEAMRAQPAWSAIPLIVLAREGVTASVQQTTSEALRGLTVVERPVRIRTLRSVVQSALRSRRHQYQIRDAIVAHEQQAAELRAREEELRRSQSELAHQAEQLRVADRRKDEFLATLAHELRNPMAPIRTGLELIQQVPASDPAARRALAVMERQLGHMVRLIDDLLDVSRISQGRVELRRERIPLQAMLDHALEASRPLVEASGHALTVQVPDEPIWLDGDLTRLAQVVTNVLNNAAKYTPPGGRIALSAAREGDEAVVRVTDNGTGITAEMLPRVFDLFTQGDRLMHRAQGGLGIGLSLVRKLLELHGGTITAQSPGPGQGSTFTLRLPLAAPLAPSAPAPPAAAAGPASGPPSARPVHRILVVDDNEDGAEMLAEMLRRRGHEARTAYDGEEALGAAQDFDPELVFLDLGLPGIDGYEVARRLRADPRRVDTFVTALTGWGSDADKQRSQAAGMDAHLTKPVDAAAVEQVLRRFQAEGRREKRG